ncbi:3'-5' exonuclease [Enterococcus timonensis]|uniref:3'-5' exonuclease n=1 Tax=Enterococcus timonensis TaxID=1852364 RepID=UPI0008D9288A|nr:3'-5' exonuclease [Enterococcus timonensis]
MNFLAMDFETANFQPYSACSLAMVMVKNNQEVGKFYTLIKPPTSFAPRNIAIHGITPAMVRTAPTFAEVWPEIARLFQPEHLIIAHNAPFDNGVLNSCLTEADLPLPQFLSLDTVKTSRKFFPEWPNHRLPTCCESLGIDLTNHHDALADARACAEILLKEQDLFGTNSLKKFIHLMN